jgi:hypothetical protein
MNTRAWQDIGRTTTQAAPLQRRTARFVTITPTTSSTSPQRSLAPREHGAYGQLGVPVVVSLALGTPNVAAFGIAIGAFATFFAHEPLLVLLGQRGAKARALDGPRAAKRLLLLGTIAVVCGGGGLFWAPTIARVGALPAVLLGCVVGGFVWRKEEKTTLGEVVAATALSGAGFPIALAEGIDVFRAALVWFVWTVAFCIATFCVRAVIARAKRSSPTLIISAYVVTITSIVASIGLAVVDQLPIAVPIALAPFELLGLGVLVAPVHTKHLRRVGWGLVAASLTTGGFVVAMFR